MIWRGLLLWLALCGAASAQVGQIPAWPPTNITSGASYSGPGNVVSGAVAWWGLRAYNAAYAASSGQLINVRLTTNNHTCDILSTAAGALGNTANCSTGGDNAQSVASFCGSNCAITEFYDQSGGNSCSSAPCHYIQVTAGSQAILVPPGSGNGCPTTSDYCASFNTQYYEPPAVGPTFSQPFTISCVAASTTNGGCFSLGGSIDISYFSGGLQIYAGNTLFVSGLTNSNWYPPFYIGNGASSNISINGTSNTGNAGTSGGGNGGSFGGPASVTWMFVEGGVWSGVFNSTQLSNSSSNIHTYWGF